MKEKNKNWEIIKGKKRKYVFCYDDSELSSLEFDSYKQLGNAYILTWNDCLEEEKFANMFVHNVLFIPDLYKYSPPFYKYAKVSSPSFQDGRVHYLLFDRNRPTYCCLFDPDHATSSNWIQFDKRKSTYHMIGSQVLEFQELES